MDWEIVKAYRNLDGYINSKKVEVSFFDLNDDGSVDDPDIFDIIVQPNNLPLTKYVFLKKANSDQGGDPASAGAAEEVATDQAGEGGGNFARNCLGFRVSRLSFAGLAEICGDPNLGSRAALPLMQRQHP